jgi:glycogen synthase
MADSPARRVLMTADTVGGVWHYAVELARALDARGVAVVLATMGAPLTEHQRAQLRGLPSLRLHESSYKLEWMQDPWADVARAGEWLLELECQHQADLVHLNQFAFGTLPFSAPTLLVAHSCVLSWWRAVHGEPAPAEWDGYRDRVTQGLRGARQVAAPTRAMLAALGREYGHAGWAPVSSGQPAPGIVLPNGRGTQLFRPAPKKPFVLAAGRLWDAAKNLAALESVAPSLAWPVRVAGSTAHPDGGTVLPTAVQALGELPPEALAAQMAQAAIYALPARYEPFGLSVLEAALSGCALVLGDIASLRETWGPAALYVAPDDPGALRAALARLIHDSAARARLAQAAHDRALHFSAQRMADSCMAAYAGLNPVFADAPQEEMQCA